MTSHSGGLELLFANERKHSVALPAKNAAAEPVNVAFLISFLCENVMKDSRKEMFVLDGSVWVSMFLS